MSSTFPDSAPAESKKRRLGGEDGGAIRSSESRSRAMKYLGPMSSEQVMNILLDIVEKVPEAFEIVEERAQADPVHRRIFIRGIPFETKIESLEKFFQKYGELDDCTIVTERGSGKSKGYGFVVFKDMDAAYAALDDPNKIFEGRKLICNLAAMRDRDEGHAESAKSSGGGADSDIRKVFIRSLSFDTSQETVRSIFSKFGRIENLHMKVDSSTGRSNGMATITFSSSKEASNAVLNAPQKIEGRQVYVQLSNQDQKLQQYPQQHIPQPAAMTGMGMMPMPMGQINPMGMGIPMNAGMGMPMNMSMGLPMNLGMGAMGGVNMAYNSPSAGRGGMGHQGPRHQNKK